MTDSRLRARAMALPGVTEKVLLDRSMFQVRGRAFATENWPEPGWAVVKLPLDAQRRLSAASLAVKPEAERGAAGVTLLRLTAIDDDLLVDVLTEAWRLAYGEKSRGVASAERGAQASLSADQA